MITGVVLGVIKLKNFAEKVTSKTDKYVVFVGEIYDQIKENYWEKISDNELSNIYLLAVNKLSGTSNTLKSQDKKGWRY